MLQGRASQVPKVGGTWHNRGGWEEGCWKGWRERGGGPRHQLPPLGCSGFAAAAGPS